MDEGLPPAALGHGRGMAVGLYLTGWWKSISALLGLLSPDTSATSRGWV